ncbi:MAG: hypothetical protein Q9204_009180 [Flavoplaca sp. TL-2023a]
MAPVGRWQKNKDLSWYAKGDNSQAATDAANARAEEIRCIKEAEQDALSEALGYPVQPRLRDSQLAGQKEVEKALKETTEGDEEGGKGVGFGSYMGIETMQQGNEEEVMKGYGGDAGGLKGGHYKAEKREHRRRRSRSPRRHERRRRSRKTAIGNLEDMRSVIEMEMVITDITADSDQDHAKCTNAEGPLDEISTL